MSRSIKKGPFVAPELIKRVDELNKAGEKKVLKTWSRASTIFPLSLIHIYSIYATATGTLRDANAGENEFTVSDVQLHGDDADNYVVDGTKTYEEPIYVSRSQVYGETGTLKLKQGEQFPADQVIKMIDQAGNKLKANEGYTLTFYYHSDTKIEKTEDLSKTGLYTCLLYTSRCV